MRKAEEHQEIQAHLKLFKRAIQNSGALSKSHCSSPSTLITLPLNSAVIPMHHFHGSAHQYLIFHFKQCRNYFTSFPCVPY